MKVLRGVNRGSTKAAEVVMVVFALVMVLSCFAQICTRLAKVPLSWSEELARYMAVWLTFVGAAYALRKSGLATVEILYQRLHGIKKKALYVIISIMILLFCAVLIYFGFAFSMKFMGQQSPALKIPKGLVYLSAPISGILMALYQLEILIDTVGKGEAG